MNLAGLWLNLTPIYQHIGLNRSTLVESGLTLGCRSNFSTTFGPATTRNILRSQHLFELPDLRRCAPLALSLWHNMARQRTSQGLCSKIVSDGQARFNAFWLHARKVAITSGQHMGTECRNKDAEPRAIDLAAVPRLTGAYRSARRRSLVLLPSVPTLALLRCASLLGCCQASRNSLTSGASENNEGLWAERDRHIDLWPTSDQLRPKSPKSGRREVGRAKANIRPTRAEFGRTRAVLAELIETPPRDRPTFTEAGPKLGEIRDQHRSTADAPSPQIGQLRSTLGQTPASFGLQIARLGRDTGQQIHD